MALPANVSFGTVTGVFLRAIIDSTEDEDRDPDGIPISGLKVVFTASMVPAMVRNLTSTPPVTFFVDPVTASTDANGVLIGPDGAPGIKLIASDDPDLDPHGWSWKVTLSSPSVSAVSFSFVLPSDSTVDLSTVVPVPSSPGTAVAVWQQAVDDTAANVALAQSAATTAQAAADSLDVSSFVKTVNGTEPDGSGNVVVAGGDGTGTVTSVNGVDPDGSGVITLDAASIGALPDDATLDALADGTTNKQFTAAEKTKLAGIATAATALAIGTTSSTAKAGDWKPAAADITNASAIGQAVITAPDPEGARSAIGAGTSDLAIGTTAGTAADAAATAAAIAAKYTLPGTGVPSSSLASAVQTSLGKADSALQSVDKTDVGLDNVDNTPDTDKPISTAVQAALDASVQYVVWTGSAWPTARSAAAVRIFVSTGDPAATAPTGLSTADQWFRDKDAV